MINSDLKKQVLAVLAKHGLIEQRLSRGIYMKDDGSRISADLRGEKPIIGMMINDTVQPDGNSNAEITQMQNEVEAIMKSKTAPPVKISEAKKSETQDNIKAGSTPAGATLQSSVSEHSEKLPPGESSQPKSKLGAGDPPAKIPMCRECGIEVSHARALACLGTNEPCTCEQCGEKQNESEQKEKLMDEKLPEVIKETENKLTVTTIKQYICQTATDAEAYNFLQLCLHRDLNPFLKEAYLIKYGTQPATMVVGKDAFTRKAEESGKLDGYEAGIIVLNKDKQIERRVGVVQFDGDVLVGGWAKVYRKDMKYPFVTEVPLNEYIKRKPDGTPQSSWGVMPGTMIRKVALVQDLREAFTKELGGCYDVVEMGAQDNIK